MATTLPRVRALHDYQARSDTELSFRRGDVLTIMDIIDDHWMRGQLAAASGFVPIAYIDPTPLPPDPIAEPSPLASTAGSLGSQGPQHASASAARPSAASAQPAAHAHGDPAPHQAAQGHTVRASGARPSPLTIAQPTPQPALQTAHQSAHQPVHSAAAVEDDYVIAPPPEFAGPSVEDTPVEVVRRQPTRAMRFRNYVHSTYVHGGSHEPGPTRRAPPAARTPEHVRVEQRIATPPPDYEC
eukprot:m.56987 g.56987  ORF g.56987 m.56987 type:complete len:242 (-) comp6805_c0_seq1:349-1074(-)